MSEEPLRMLPEGLPTFEKGDPLNRLFKGSGQILERIGLQPSFVVDLINEDDWGFTLKCHSLLDAALERTILNTCFNSRINANKEDIQRLVSSLSFDGRTSKLAYANTFKLLTKNSVSYAKALNVVRNKFAHSIHHTNKTILSICNENASEHLLEKLIPASLNDDVRKSPILTKERVAIFLTTVLYDLHMVEGIHAQGNEVKARRGDKRATSQARGAPKPEAP